MEQDDKPCQLWPGPVGAQEEAQNPVGFRNAARSGVSARPKRGRSPAKRFALHSLFMVAVLTLAGCMGAMTDEEQPLEIPEEASRPDWSSGQHWVYRSDAQPGDWEADLETVSIHTVTELRTNPSGSYWMNEQKVLVLPDSRDGFVLSESIQHHISDDVNPVTYEHGEMEVFQFPLTEDREWNWSYDGFSFRAEVSEPEELQIPAGRFAVFPVEIKSNSAYNPEVWVQRWTYYYAPEAANWVMRETYEFPSAYSPDLESTEVLVALGTQDDDNDGLGNAAEIYFGWNSDHDDTDQDGVTDDHDRYPAADLRYHFIIGEFSANGDDGPLNGEVDPYVVVEHGNQRENTSVQHETNSGSFDETLEINVPDHKNVDWGDFLIWLYDSDQGQVADDGQSGDDPFDLSAFHTFQLELVLEPWEGRIDISYDTPYTFSGDDDPPGTLTITVRLV